ncbi:hypothetical protein FS749_000302 [Ceratobasidium sp. UAMH 11750]|nr:hypothetical protein FS749_000302 [Ceratobasidium sp. UAMH 11750]
MDSSNKNVILCFGTIAAGALLITLARKKRRSSLSLPPGPQSYPFVGHLLSMPKSFEHLRFAELGRQIGSDIISFSFFRTTIIAINSAQPALDLFEKRSAIYSGRTCPPALGEPTLMNWGNFIGFVGYSDLWRKYRRMMHIWLNKQAVTVFYPSQQRQARLLLQRLLSRSDDLSASEKLDLELYMTISSTLLKTIYGYNLQRLDDPFLLGMKEAATLFGKAASPSSMSRSG